MNMNEFNYRVKCFKQLVEGLCFSCHLHIPSCAKHLTEKSMKTVT